MNDLQELIDFCGAEEGRIREMDGRTYVALRFKSGAWKEKSISDLELSRSRVRPWDMFFTLFTIPSRAESKESAQEETTNQTGE